MHTDSSGRGGWNGAEGEAARCHSPAALWEERCLGRGRWFGPLETPAGPAIPVRSRHRAGLRARGEPTPAGWLAEPEPLRLFPSLFGSPPTASERSPKAAERRGRSRAQRQRRFESPLGAVHHANRLKAAPRRARGTTRRDCGWQRAHRPHRPHRLHRPHPAARGLLPATGSSAIGKQEPLRASTTVTPSPMHSYGACSFQWEAGAGWTLINRRKREWSSSAPPHHRWFPAPSLASPRLH